MQEPEEPDETLEVSAPAEETEAPVQVPEEPDETLKVSAPAEETEDHKIDDDTNTSSPLGAILGGLGGLASLAAAVSIRHYRKPAGQDAGQQVVDGCPVDVIDRSV